MTARKYDYEFYLKNSKKLREFLKTYEDRKSTHRAYKLHLIKYFQENNIKDVDSYVKDTRVMDKTEKINYLDNLEKQLTEYWKKINKEYTGKTPYVWLSAVEMFLIHNKTFELDDLYIKLQKNGHGNYARTNTKTPTKEQLKKIFSYSNPESKALFIFQMVTGQRIGQVINTTFDNIEGLGKEWDKKNINYEIPRIFYPESKQGYIVKTRITPECKKLLLEYLDQRDKFIETRTKRGEHKRNNKLDMNRLFPMDVNTANQIWTTMCKNAGLYELDPVTNKPVFGTHCLRRYFLSHFTDREMGDYFSGHITARNKEYRQYSDEKLDGAYKKNMNDLFVFEGTPDITEVNKEIVGLKKENEQLRKDMQSLMIKVLSQDDKEK